MIRWGTIISLFLFTGLTTMVEQLSAYAQGAKIQRSIAKLSVHPQMVVRGNEITAVVEPFDDRALLRISVIRPTGEVLVREQLKGNAPVLSVVLNVPEGTQGSLRVVLESRRGINWTPAASEEVRLLPGFWNDLSGLIDRLEKIEKQAEDSNPVLLQGAWSALAFAEDLMERVKLSEPNQWWEAQRRLAVLRVKTESLEQGNDPSAKSSGYQLRGYRSELNGEIQLYSMYIPKGYGIDPGQQWPMVVMLHGAFSNHHLALRRVMGYTNSRGENDPAAKRFMPSLPDMPYIVVAPNGFETSWYKDYAEDDVWRVINDIQSQFNIDPNRVYLTGLSMGGMGTGKLGIAHADRFAAIAPVCGFFNGPFEDAKEEKPAFQQRLVQCAAPIEAAVNAQYLPVKLMHGEIDPIVPVQESIELHETLDGLKYRNEIEVYPGVAHDAWVSAYEDARIFEWFSQFERNPAPEKVIYKTGDPQGGSLYWVRIEEPAKIRRLAQIEAEVMENNKVVVKTDNIECFALTVPESLIPVENNAEVEIDGTAVYQGALGKEIRFVRNDDGWKWTSDARKTHLLPSVNGVFAALYKKHVFVYGTEGTSAEDQAVQSLAANYSLPGPWVDVQFPVLPETEITPEIIKDNHLVLFATIRGSSFLQNHLSKLPIDTDGDQIQIAGRKVKPDQALIFICPNPANTTKYLLVCTSSTLEGLQALRQIPSGKDSLFVSPPGDFAIIGADGKPVWGGLFDKNWNIDEAGDF